MSDVDESSEASTSAAAAAELGQSLPPVSDFSSFALSLAANAMMNLSGDALDGRVASPASINIKAAAEYIDILVMLQQKTQGNLGDDEVKLLDSLLYDLRMQYVEVAGR